MIVIASAALAVKPVVQPSSGTCPGNHFLLRGMTVSFLSMQMQPEFYE